MNWKPSDDGHWKMNTDTAWFDSSNSGGISWIIRDSIGSLIGARCAKSSKKENIKMLEAKAILKGINFMAEKIRDYPVLLDHPLVVESDAVEIIRLINQEAVDDSEISLVID